MNEQIIELYSTVAVELNYICYKHKLLKNNFKTIIKKKVSLNIEMVQNIITSKEKKGLRELDHGFCLKLKGLVFKICLFFSIICLVFCLIFAFLIYICRSIVNLIFGLLCVYHILKKDLNKIP